MIVTLAGRLTWQAHRAWTTLRSAVERFLLIDGFLWASAFAYNAFFSLFPLIVLLVTGLSFFTDRARAATVIIGHVERYVPITGPMQGYVFDTVAGVVNARGRAGVVALLLLVWVAMQCITTLVSATNLAWDAAPYDWWRLPLKSLVLFGILAVAVLLVIELQVLAAMATDWLFPAAGSHPWLRHLWTVGVPLLAGFFSLSLFYKYSPRRPTGFVEVRFAALCSTILLWVAGKLFLVYLRDFATLNALYGAFGGIMALLLWIYVSGCIFVFGACLCFARAKFLSPAVPRL